MIKFIFYLSGTEKVVGDVRNYSTAEQENTTSGRSRGDSWSPDIYHNLQEIQERMFWLAQNHPELVAVEELGRSHEGRSIDVLTVREPGPHCRPVIWLDCGIHSREWISPPACLHAVARLVEMANALDPRENLLSVYDFYILPVVNPDGYAYSWSSDRMWRGNRNPNYTYSNCSGVDINRNFPQFKNGTREEIPCSETFRGEAPFSEPESRAIRDGLERIRSLYGPNKIAAYVSVHAFSQMWLSPYGYTNNRTEDYGDQMRVMRKAVEALKSVHGTEFTYGPLTEILYEAPGTSIDWAYDELGVKYSFTPELRPAGPPGFLLPADQIRDTVVETWAAIAAMAREIAPEFGIYI